MAAILSRHQCVNGSGAIVLTANLLTYNWSDPSASFDLNMRKSISDNIVVMMVPVTGDQSCVNALFELRVSIT